MQVQEEALQGTGKGPGFTPQQQPHDLLAQPQGSAKSPTCLCFEAYLLGGLYSLELFRTFRVIEQSITS
jgi:hypothetical protein